MSITKGKLRRSAVVVAFSLGAFQALSIVGANVASAVAVACTFNSGTLTVQFNGAGHTISQDAIGNILVDGLKTSATVPTCTTSLDATIANTTQININGTPGAGPNDDAVSIMTYKPFPAACPVTGCTTANWGSINWTVNLGDNTVPAAPGDSLTIDNSLNVDNNVKTDWGVNGIDLNGDGNLDVALVSVEVATDIAGMGTAGVAAETTGDTINAGGSTITGAAFPTSITIDGSNSVADDLNITGGAGNDTLTGGGTSYATIAGGLGNDTIDCDTYGAVDYTGSATAVVVDLGANTGTGEGFDSILTCDDINGSDHGDTLTGNALANWIYVGAGNDTVDGVSGPHDTYDVGAASAGVTVDLTAGTSTGGSGTDTLKHIDDVSGSESDDSFTGNSGDNVLFGEGGNDTLSGGAGNNDGADSFDGGSGIDTVDYGKNTLGTTVNLAALSTANNCAYFDPSYPIPLPLNGQADCGVGGIGSEDLFLNSTIENAILGTGNDVFTGSLFNNTVWPNGGQNSLNGCPVGIAVGCGIDTINYSQGYDAGVTVNISGGGPTSGNSDSAIGFTNVVGTAFADTIIGTDANIGNSLKGGKGNDTISGNNGPDFVLGGAGNDAIRGGGGDDTLKGQGGKDNIRGSGGADDIFGGKGVDFCDGGGGSDLIKTCEKPKDKHGNGPNGPGLHQRI